MARAPARHNGTGRTYMPRSATNDALEQRVYGVEKGQSALSERIDNLGAGIDGRLDRLTQTIERRFSEFAAARAPAWGAFSIIAAVSIFVLSSFGALSVAFIQGQIGEVHARTTENREGLAATIPRIELEKLFKFLDDRDDRMSNSLVDLRKETVSQAEHTALLDRVTKVEDQVSAITPAGSAIRDILERLKSLEERPYRGNWNGTAP